MPSLAYPMHCHLLVPGLFFPFQPGEENPLARTSSSALCTLLARGRQERGLARGMEEWLCRAFGVEKQMDWPVASLALLADGGPRGNGNWLRADPVHLSLQRDRLILADSDSFSLSGPEARTLADTLNHHFSAEGLEFLPLHPLRWYLRLQTVSDMQTVPLPEARGRDVRTMLPRGKDALRWSGILTEIQMLFHDHPVNEAREARGELPINSVWLWGGGRLPERLGRPFDKVWADDPLALGLASAAGSIRATLPPSAEDWLAAASAGSHLVVLDSLRPAAQRGDVSAWNEGVKSLEARWFGPLKRAVQAGKLAVTLHIPAATGSLSVTASRTDLWKIWRRPRPLAGHFQP
ncbi:MAG: phosphoglycerate mutase [Pseudomonadota bacterium]